jgi:hypothetical protein
MFQVSIRNSCITKNQTLPSLFRHSLTISKDNLVERLSKFAVITVANLSPLNYITCFSRRGVNHKLTPPYFPELNGIGKGFVEQLI